MKCSISSNSDIDLSREKNKENYNLGYLKAVTEIHMPIINYLFYINLTKNFLFSNTIRGRTRRNSLYTDPWIVKKCIFGPNELHNKTTYDYRVVMNITSLLFSPLIYTIFLAKFPWDRCL